MTLSAVDPEEAGHAQLGEDGHRRVPLDPVPRRVFGLQLADLLDVDPAVLQPHHADTLPELDRVDAGADRAARPLHLVVGLVLVDHDREPVVEERPPPEVGAVDLQQVARGPAQGRELAPAALAHQSASGRPGFTLSMTWSIRSSVSAAPLVPAETCWPAGTALRSPSKLLGSVAESPMMKPSLNL